ncbi:MAG TPA: DNA repair protein RecO [Sedimenticola thiotaurini]|uniref:DNA repair protein RecO n=1 Tax=Sedimenticola thiotaurini TaxID=1543721 RepID=A0A831WBF8_9GAMM|nr:DNA repair protein RecO [Sedimenticola thiotaurini]
MGRSSPTALGPAFVLHRRAYGNHGLLLEFFTPEAGRLAAVARGVKGRRGGGGAALLQPFTPLLIAWSGRGEVKTLVRYEAAAAPLPLAGRALYCGFYLNELLLRLTRRGDPGTTLFSHYAGTLERLADPEALEPALRRFELQLLECLGYGLILDREAETDSPLVPERRYHYRPEQGPVPARPGDADAISGATLLALHRDRPLGPRQLAEARRLSRQVLAHYLGDRPLKSRELFDHPHAAGDDDR